MSFEFVLRLIGMVVLAFGGLKLGVRLATLADSPPEVWALVASLIGALFGLILTPYFTTRPARLIRDYLSKLPAQQLVAGVVGLIVGLIIAALVSLPLSLLPPPYNAILPVVAAIVFGYFGTSIFAMRRRDVFELFQGHIPAYFGGSEEGSLTPSRQVLLDTSVIIDGRIADISQTGFIMGPMVVPRFVLNELQHIADSSDVLRRNRGRRGLDMLNRLQKESAVPVRITDMDVEEADDVDEKLVLLAKKLGCAIVTNDFNLNRVAELQGVVVLNINELANAVKTVYLPGEEMEIQIIQEGKELGQGVGYLDDGTMVVVEGGRRHMSQTIQATVTKVLQTSAGRMIFARPSDTEQTGSHG
ncbi:MAG TPA: PIN domain nuclease [Chloroflexi bacterium]|nr:PIN domain nuclease [Chloroflexota bacterium]